jgi:GNAT superfamily N-acetyltransferase
MTDQQHQWIWTEQGVDAQGLRRPDDKWLLKLPSEHEDLWSALIERAWADLSAPMLVNTTDNNQSQRDALLAAGFMARRIEELWRIPVAALAGRTVEATFHRLVPLDQCDLARVVELDNAVRSDIPGAEAWRGSLADLSASMADDEFDPELYLIAEHTSTGAYDGLVRVWNRVPLPRLGCLGVRAPWRRTRLPVALMSAAATVLAQRGVT